MNRLTLDQLQEIVYSATSSAKALFNLMQCGANVYNSAFRPEWYSVTVDGHCVSFSDNPNDALFYVFFDHKMVTKEVRAQFLESQREKTFSVAAVEPVEARPTSSDQLSDTIPQTTVQMLDCFRFIFGIDTANGHYQDILFDVMKSHLFSHAINFNDLTVYEIRILMMTADSIFDHLMSIDLSTESVDK
ncbi:hypothetical protein EMM73_16035 [Rheinheimera sediminis]|uniref:hypothetical protein n=1 Tax=Rheinheimera sp. YQF-1 TaxID=2499626 RepID=UPI000FD78368|nr:hypothetical protein [Rheinheimera sp. YQF-1]RVT44641.1 hypothetical protein EMM73_16035 [Rheinheimera sp. YQF-1]